MVHTVKPEANQQNQMEQDNPQAVEIEENPSPRKTGTADAEPKFGALYYRSLLTYTESAAAAFSIQL